MPIPHIVFFLATSHLCACKGKHYTIAISCLSTDEHDAPSQQPCHVESLTPPFSSLSRSLPVSAAHSDHEKLVPTTSSALSHQL